MHWIQDKLLQVARLHDVDDMRLVDLVEMVGCEHPSQVRHHKQQLINKGMLVRKNGRLVPALKTHAALVTIPVLGEADCGEATKYADGRIVDNLALSPSVLNVQPTDSMYALVARGDSMNRATVNNKTIEDGDYIIIEKKDSYVPKDGDIVLSIIAGLANIKRLRRDNKQQRLLLLSESRRQADFAPIIISEQDDFAIDGKVVDVIKGVEDV